MACVLNEYVINKILIILYTLTQVGKVQMVISTVDFELSDLQAELSFLKMRPNPNY